MISRNSILIASMWVMVAYGLSMIIRLGGNLVVTRLLEPEMFGLMAIVYVIMQGLAMFSDLGLWTFIVRHKDGTDSEILNVVWSMQVVRGWIMFFVLSVTAIILFAVKIVFQLDLPGVYGQDILPAIMLVVGVSAVISGYNSMAPAVISREVKRGKLESIDLVTQILAVVVMITWALIQPTIWALVSASVVASLSTVFLTYKAFSIRHRFCWDKNIVTEVYDFGKWIVLASILTYIAQQGDRLFFGAYISPALLGVYSIAFLMYQSLLSIAQKLTFKIWFPVLSETVHNDLKSLKQKYYKIRLRQDFILFLLVGIIYSGADLIIDFLYDDRYKDAGWMLKILSISLVGQGLSVVGLECMSALGVTKYRVYVMLVRGVGLLIGLPVSFYFFSLEGAIYCVALNVFLGLPVLYWELYKNGIFSFYREIRVLPVVLISALSTMYLITY